MICFSKINDLHSALLGIKTKKKKVGFIPTMGALHKGHVSLIQNAKNISDIVICSIFVNPTQFNKETDFKKYPNLIEKDKTILRQECCDILFLPSIQEIYPNSIGAKKFDLGDLTNQMEGKYRPGHFDGVITIVKKLFELVQPNFAFFGEKDFQQLAIINKITKDYYKNIKIVACPTIRDNNGLALSSRNELLSSKDKEKASIIYKSLKDVKNNIKTSSIQKIKKRVLKAFIKSSLKLEYLEIVNSTTLKPMQEYNPTIKSRICIAAYVGNIRLIDNLHLN